MKYTLTNQPDALERTSPMRITTGHWTTSATKDASGKQKLIPQAVAYFVRSDSRNEQRVVVDAERIRAGKVAEKWATLAFAYAIAMRSERKGTEKLEKVIAACKRAGYDFDYIRKVAGECNWLPTVGTDKAEASDYGADPFGGGALGDAHYDGDLSDDDAAEMSDEPKFAVNLWSTRSPAVAVRR